jgi:outer membrane protein assembly factor BamB
MMAFMKNFYWPCYLEHCMRFNLSIELSLMEGVVNLMRGSACLAVLVVAFALNAKAQTLDVKEDDRPAPVDWGYGPGVRPDKNRKAVQEMMAAPAAAPVAAADAQTRGVFGAPVTWPIIAIHVVLLPDGRVMSYGTDEQGQQGAQFVYDIWNPGLGTDTAAHTMLPNTTSTDIFCAGQSLIAGNGEVLIVGGDLTINGKRNFSNDSTTIFSPQTNALRTTDHMQYPRWYPSVIALPNGEMLVLGGREAPGPIPVTIPEVFTPNVGWRTLWDATIGRDFYYTRAFVAPNGRVFVLGYDGNVFYLDPAGNGTITQLTQQTLAGSHKLPSVMFAAGRILSLRSQKVIVVDVNGAQPSITPTADTSQLRLWSNATVLADGKVLVTGGSAVDDTLTGVAYAAEVWDPATGQWTLGANAVKPRLYHSVALLLPDGSVLTAGGGAPGPVKNLNAEIYYPPYLFDGSGQPAARPAIVNAPGLLPLHLNQQFAVTMGGAEPISRVTLVRTGSVTHAFNPDQRFMQLGFTQVGQTLTITLPTIDPNVVVPGYYLLFVFDQAGVPSVARIVQVVG